MADESIPPLIAGLSFEEALAQLEDIVRKLEDGTGKLDEGIVAYEQGALLKRHCEAKLKEARARVEKVVLGADGSVGTEPADIR